MNSLVLNTLLITSVALMLTAVIGCVFIIIAMFRLLFMSGSGGDK